MAGINSTMNIARQGLAAQQLGLNVTGHNIANVNNPSFSRQSVPQAASSPINQSGFLLGTGVESQQVRQSADQLLEDRITTQKSAYSASEAFMSYMKVLAGMFSESSGTSISKLLPDFWDSWNTLANNPDGAAERMNVYENGVKLSERFNIMERDLWQMEQDLHTDIQSGVHRVNQLTVEIARLNQSIMGQESQRTSNDNRDLRNEKIKELSEIIDIKSFEDEKGAVTITTAGGFPLVSGNSSYDLKYESGQVKWVASDGGRVDITERIQGGKLGGWLEMRDVEIPRYRREMDALARETIWNVNKSHSMGAGSYYMTEPLKGTYQPRESNWLATLPYGERIDYSKDFGMWVENKGTIPSSYTQTVVDMGVSTAATQNWSGTGAADSRYDFEVVRSGTTGESLWLADGQNLGTVQTAGDPETALAQAIRRQTLTITDGSGNVQTLEIGHGEGMIEPSSAAIAAALNGVDGLQSYSLSNQLELDIDSIMGSAHMQEHDEVMFTLIAGDIREEVVFRVGEDDATTRSNFDAALRAVVDQSEDLNLEFDPSSGATVAVLKSAKGDNLGIADFRVVDNTSMSLDTFVEDGGGSGLASFTLGGVEIRFHIDESDQEATAKNLEAALMREKTALQSRGISWERNGNAVNLWGSGGAVMDISGLNTRLDDEASAGTGGFTVTGASGTLVDNTDAGSVALVGNTVSGVTVAPDEQAAGTVTLGVDSEALGGGGPDSAMKTATFTVFAAPGMEIRSSADPARGSLFNVTADSSVPAANAILTLGGDGGFTDFNVGDVVSFQVDGVTVTFPVTASDDRTLAGDLETALLGAGLDASLYRIAGSGSSVSILRNDGENIRISDFEVAGNPAAKLSVVTGSGFGLEGPFQLVLDNANPHAESAVFGTGAAMEWREYDSNGEFTGRSGLIPIQDSGPYGLSGTDLSFNLAPGTLVAGNTFSINTDDAGRAAPLNMSLKGRAGSINDSYIFTVKPPGGALGEETVTLQWESRYGHGEVVVEVDERTKPPIYVEVDGMRLGFDSGILFKDDIFVIETDANGNGTLLKGSDWHWTTDSFAAQFNRQGEGVTARVLHDGSLEFTTKTPTFAISDLGCSGVNGFCDVNTRITILDATALQEEALDFGLERDEDGKWSIRNDYTRGVARLVPEDGDDSGFGIDLNGNGLADIQLNFDQPVTGSGYVELDILKRKPDHYGFAFSGETAHDSGLAAALGVNTFYTGTDAASMKVNDVVKETGLISAGTIDPATGKIRPGDGSTAIAMADLQGKSIQFEEWSFSRSGKAFATQTDASLEGYYQKIVGNMGTRYQTELRSMEFYGTMLYNLGQQRDSLSAVSLDEEMVNLIKYQQAYTAAAKLITVSDEMLSTLVNMR
ncbi:flagellar hook-associated protein FlgK [Desulfobotulus sp. H1]|uniref:Flagellar hook-associated protein 1 n=1 Tax=Desulfobotulus pelophilus TaxID=2823377 RepID=A0ABT3N4I6_9BACT|nr:flagellar hook-associated protein FlgK [Desulfobotulus pelophilus]MCW7752380.1 flagellar hook-associated protein FlgK [Desulfobotulus pelophilus]